jgi:hypothetical protein
MNEMLRKQEREKQQQSESIRNMFQMLGFQPPSGYMEPSQAGAVVGVMEDRAGETRKDAATQRKFSDARGAFVSRVGDKYGPINTPADLELALGQYERDQQVSKEKTMIDYRNTADTTEKQRLFNDARTAFLARVGNKYGAVDSPAALDMAMDAYERDQTISGQKEMRDYGKEPEPIGNAQSADSAGMLEEEIQAIFGNYTSPPTQRLTELIAWKNDPEVAAVLDILEATDPERYKQLGELYSSALLKTRRYTRQSGAVK